MFVSRLKTEDVPPNLWRVLYPLVWDDRPTTLRDDAGYGLVEFPAGMVTDLGSVPHSLRAFDCFDPCGPSRRACVGHDYLYTRGKWPDGRIVTREAADEFLRVALIADGLSERVARSWWLGVRLGGWVPWRAYRIAEADTGA